MGTILTSHRAKLGGRYHLILPSLQGLMRCLFLSHARLEDLTANWVLPLWVGAKGSTLDSTHAAAYARLLTTICDPTGSSVARSKKSSRQDLNDETKKARSIAGQHLPYLIMEYCRCQIRGRLRLEVKEALTPGLYAVFDVMAPDTMRAINAAMDSSSRAIFKALYQDYRRFGRWEGA